MAVKIFQCHRNIKTIIGMALIGSFIISPTTLATPVTTPILKAAANVPADQVQISAAAWLVKMDKALKQQNYAGTFIFARGKHFETIEIVHQNKDNEEFERLTSLNGEQREIIRQHGETVCYHLASDHVELSHPMPMGPFSYSFREKLSVNQSMYNITKHGIERIAGHNAMRVAISPNNANRYGYRLWIDQDSGLLLKANLVNNGKVLEFFQFSSVKIGGEISDADFNPSFADNAISHRLTRENQAIARKQNIKHDWRVAWIPQGFRRVKAAAANSMSFSDGIASLSVFVEHGKKASLGNTQALIGGTVVITRQIEGSNQQITVVGEVPLETAKKVAESIEPVIY